MQTSIKLSEIKDQLEKCAELGVPLKLGERIVHFNFAHRPMFSWHDELSHFEQALLIAALEQFVESRGYWFEFGKTKNIHYVWILSPNDDDIERQKANASTRLQATLAAFLSVDWGRE